MSARYRQLAAPVRRDASSPSSGGFGARTGTTHRVLEASAVDATAGDGPSRTTADTAVGDEPGSETAGSNGADEETAGSNATARSHSVGHYGTGDRTIRTDGGRNQRDQQAATREQPDDTGAISITFLDRETVRITGDLEEMLLSLCWWDESGLLGTITEPIGGVTGKRVVTASGAFADQEFAYGPVVTGVEGFTAPGPSVPGTGDVSAANPDVEAHVETVRDEYGGSGDLEEPFPDGN